MTPLETLLAELQAKSEALRAEVPTLLESQSPEEIQDQCIRRGEFRNDCQKAIDQLRDHMRDMDSACRKIRQIKADQALDNEKLEAAKWGRIHDRKSHGA